MSTPLNDVTLDEKHDVARRHVLINGNQALVRALLLQRERDRAAGLNTAGYVSGYRGSPLGGLDVTLWSAGKRLQAADVTFVPGINEDLAATAVWGTQQLGAIGDAKVDGVCIRTSARSLSPDPAPPASASWPARRRRSNA